MLLASASMTDPQLPEPDQLERRVLELFDLWRIADRAVTVAWNGRLTTTAGRAFVRRGHIELNPRVLARAVDQVDMVLTHEAAHVAAFRLFGDAAADHGRHWRGLMRLAGHAPEVTHKIPVDDLRRQRRRRPRYVYLRLCGACGDRLLASAVRYGRCAGCERRDDFLVVRAPATAAGRAALERMSDAEVRSHFA